MTRQTGQFLEQTGRTFVALQSRGLPPVTKHDEFLLVLDRKDGIAKFSANGGPWTPLVGPSDVLVGVTAADTTPGYLAAKVAAGVGIALAVLNPGGNEQLEITATGVPGFSGWVDDGAVVRLATDTDRVGVGTVTPAAQLEVEGDGLSDQTQIIAQKGSAAQTAPILATQDEAGALGWHVTAGNDWAEDTEAATNGAGDIRGRRRFEIYGLTTNGMDPMHFMSSDNVDMITVGDVTNSQQLTLTDSALVLVDVGGAPAWQWDGLEARSFAPSIVFDDGVGNAQFRHANLTAGGASPASLLVQAQGKIGGAPQPGGLLTLAGGDVTIAADGGPVIVRSGTPGGGNDPGDVSLQVGTDPVLVLDGATAEGVWQPGHPSTFLNSAGDPAATAGTAKVYAKGGELYAISGGGVVSQLTPVSSGVGGSGTGIANRMATWLNATDIQPAQVSVDPTNGSLTFLAQSGTLVLGLQAKTGFAGSVPFELRGQNNATNPIFVGGGISLICGTGGGSEITSPTILLDNNGRTNAMRGSVEVDGSGSITQIDLTPGLGGAVRMLGQGGSASIGQFLASRWLVEGAKLLEFDNTAGNATVRPEQGGNQVQLLLVGQEWQGGATDAGDVIGRGGQVTAGGTGADGEVRLQTPAGVDRIRVGSYEGPIFPEYTVAGIGSASPSGQVAIITDETGGRTIATSDGANWRRVSDGAIIS